MEVGLLNLESHKHSQKLAGRFKNRITCWRGVSDNYVADPMELPSQNLASIHINVST